LRRRDIAEVERLELERDVARDRDAGGIEIIDDRLVVLVRREQHHALEAERLQRVQHQPAGGDRVDAGGVAHDVEDFAFALRSLRHRGIGAVEDDQVRRAVGEELRRGRDLVRHRRQRPLPRARHARPRDMNAEVLGCETVELRLAERVDRRDDQPDAALRYCARIGRDNGGDIHGETSRFGPADPNAVCPGSLRPAVDSILASGARRSRAAHVVPRRVVSARPCVS
jgi:hypothetical protein